MNQQRKEIKLKHDSESIEVIYFLTDSVTSYAVGVKIKITRDVCLI
jgi:hypothetical protein